MENEINILDYWNVMMRWKKTIIGTVFVVTLLAICICLILPRVYRASALILPMGGPKPASILAALGGVLDSRSSSSNPSNQIMVILKSITMNENIIKKYDLMKKIYEKDGKPPEKAPTMEKAVRNLMSMMFFAKDEKSQIIEIRAEMNDPKMAAELVNTYVKELDKALRQNVYTDAKRHRIFIEKQLEKNNSSLLNLGKELSFFYANNRISNTNPTVDVNIWPEVKKWKDDLDLIPFNGNENSGASLVETPQEIQRQTEELQSKLKEAEDEVKKVEVIHDVPQQVYLEYLEHQNRITAQINALLVQQYEVAKADESREDLNFQVIDWARVPEEQIKPERRKIVVVSFILSFGLSVFMVLFIEYVRKLRTLQKTPTYSAG